MPADANADAEVVDDEHEDPRGTMVLMLLFLLLIAAMWIWAYYALWSRG
ncbi:MAG: hypothetical protein ACR2O6_12715 [Ilumatobacteraceae bacterium]